MAYIDGGTEYGYGAEIVEENSLRSSVFIITVNTNKVVFSMEEINDVWRSKFKSAIDAMLRDVERWLESEDGYGHDVVNWDTANLEWSIEMGNHPKGRRLHIHITFGVHHSTKLKVNISEIRAIFAEELDISSPWVGVRAGNDTNHAMKVYLQKKLLEEEYGTTS